MENLRHPIWRAADYCAEKTTDYDQSHDFNHHRQVYKNAVNIMKHMTLSNEEKIIVGIACMLHDVADHKYDLDGNKYRELENWLRTNLPKYTNSVLTIINNISFSKEDKLRKQNIPMPYIGQLALLCNIVSDADKLEALGTRGLERCQIYTRKMNPDANQETINQLVVQHCHDKLLRLLPEYFIKTNIGRIMAVIPHKQIEDFVKSQS